MATKNGVAYALFEVWKANYENGQPKPPSRHELNEMTKERAHDTVCILFKEIFNYLNITPTKIPNRVSEEFLREMKLNGVFMHLQFPLEYSSKMFSYVHKIDYLARLLYPGYFTAYECSSEYLWDLEYANCEVSKIKTAKYKITLSNDYEYSCKKITYLFNKYLNTHPIPFDNTDDSRSYLEKCYEFFGSSKKAKTYISKALLLKPCESLFDSPLEMFHLSLPKNQRSEFLYNFELYKKAFSPIKKKG